MVEPTRPQDLEIRAMRDDDVTGLIQLWEAAGLTRPWNNPENDIALARAAPAAEILVGLAPDGMLIASAMLGWDGHRGGLYYLAVHAEHQGAGHGRTMLKVAETRLREMGAEKVNLLVRTENTGVIAFYERHGYSPGTVTQFGKWLIDNPAAP